MESELYGKFATLARNSLVHGINLSSGEFPSKVLLPM